MINTNAPAQYTQTQQNDLGSSHRNQTISTVQSEILGLESTGYLEPVQKLGSCYKQIVNLSLCTVYRFKTFQNSIIMLL